MAGVKNCFSQYLYIYRFCVYVVEAVEELRARKLVWRERYRRII